MTAVWMERATSVTSTVWRRAAMRVAAIQTATAVARATASRRMVQDVSHLASDEKTVR